MVIRESDPPLIELRNGIDIHCALRLRAAAEELITRGHTDIQVCCAGMGSIDSAAVSALFDAYTMARAVGGSLRLFFPSESFRRKLRLSGVEEWFEIIDGPDGEEIADDYSVDRWRTSRFVVPARLENSAYIRRKVSILAHTMPFTEQQVEDINLAVGEAASNAIRHGSPDGEKCRVTVLCEKHDDRFAITIKDQGHGFDPESRICHNPYEPVEGGRGLFFMRMLMDEVAFCFDRGTTVMMMKKTQSN